MNKATKARMTMTVKLKSPIRLGLQHNARRVNFPTPATHGPGNAPHKCHRQAQATGGAAPEAGPGTAQHFARTALMAEQEPASSGNGSGQNGSEPQVSILA